MLHEILSQYFEDIDDSMFIFQNILAFMGRENTQGVAFINRLAAVADVELSIDVAQVLFYSCRSLSFLSSDIHALGLLIASNQQLTSVVLP